MTRVTAFGLPKRREVASSWNELSQKPGESSKSVHQEREGANEADKKRKRGDDAEDKAGSRNNDSGWGGRGEVKRRADKSEQRRVSRVNDRQSSTTCFACRQQGHAARDCPNVLLAAQGDGDAEAASGEPSKDGSGKKKGMKRAKGKMGSDVAGSGGRCYRCDSSEHPLSRCPKPAHLGIPFANCFICLQQGHLASKCPQNSRGVYPNGGSCKVCRSVQHRANDCPDDKRGRKPDGEGREDGGYEWKEELKALGDEKGVVLGLGEGAGADEDDFMIVKRRRIELEKKVEERRSVEKAEKMARKAKEKREMAKVERSARQEHGDEGVAKSVVYDAPTRAEQESAPAAKAVTKRKSAPSGNRKPKVVSF